MSPKAKQTTEGTGHRAGPFAFDGRRAVTIGLIQRNKLPVHLVYPSLRVGEGMLRMTLLDYVAISVLIILIVWAMAERIL